MSFMILIYKSIYSDSSFPNLNHYNLVQIILMPDLIHPPSVMGVQ
jgi:hypothetical protein